MSKSIERQIGGNHYKHFAMQPVMFIMGCGLDYIQGNIIKYVLRHKYKNGAEDLEKAIHYCEIANDIEGTQFVLPTREQLAMCAEFCRLSVEDKDVQRILYLVVERSWAVAKNMIENIKNKNYCEYVQENE